MSSYRACNLNKPFRSYNFVSLDKTTYQHLQLCILCRQGGDTTSAEVPHSECSSHEGDTWFHFCSHTLNKFYKTHEEREFDCISLIRTDFQGNSHIMPKSIWKDDNRKIFSAAQMFFSPPPYSRYEPLPHVPSY